MTLGTVLVSDHPHGKGKFPNIRLEFSGLQLPSMACYPTPVHLREESAPIFSVLSTGKTTIKFSLCLFSMKYSSFGLSSYATCISFPTILVAFSKPLQGRHPILANSKERDFVYIYPTFNYHSAVFHFYLPGINCKIHTEQITRDFVKEFVVLSALFPFHVNGVTYLIKAPWEPQTHCPSGSSSSRNLGSSNSPVNNNRKPNQTKTTTQKKPTADRQTKLQTARNPILTVGCFLLDA